MEVRRLMEYMHTVKKPKSLGMAYFLLFFLWPTGAHNFYLERTAQGIAFIAGYVIWAGSYALLVPVFGGEGVINIGGVEVSLLAVIYSGLFILPMLVESLLLNKRVEDYNRDAG